MILRLPCPFTQSSLASLRQVYNRRTLQMFKNMNMDKNTQNIISKELQISTADGPAKYQERNALSPLSIKDNKVVFNEFSTEEQDFCSDDSVKDPDYENKSESTNSETDAKKLCAKQRQKKISKTKNTPNKMLNFDVRKPLQLLQNKRDYVSTLQTMRSNADNKLNTQPDCNEIDFAGQNFSTKVTDGNIEENISDLATSTLSSIQQRSSSSSSSSTSSSSDSSNSSDSSSSSDSESERRSVAGVILSDKFPVVENNASTETALSNQNLENFNSAANSIIALNTTDTQNSASLVLEQEHLDAIDNPLKTIKITRKRKLNTEKWACVQAKILRNRGQEYKSKCGKIVQEKSMKAPCGDKCKQKCTNKITETQRKDIFDSYWNIGDLHKQREFILRHTSIIKPRYSYKVHNSNRGNNNAFYLTVDGERIRVCKQYFKATLDISDRPIRTVLEKIKKSGSLDLDQRGKHNNHHAVDPAIKDGVRKHLNSIPKIESHYCRADTKRVYIDGGKTVADLHRDYVAECQSKGLPSATYIMYYNIFTYENNISFFQPKKDQCEDCTAYVNATEEEKNGLKEKYEKHLEEKNLSRQAKDDDKNHTADNTIVCVYDLQAAMSCPRGEVSNFYYVSKLNCYNFTICNIKNKEVSCFVWHEGQAKRGAVEIGTCVLKYIKNLKQTAENLDSKLDLVFYSDNCCGQQKNHYIIALYIFIVHNFNYINTITHKFLIKGHTQNEGDSAHSVIERQIQKTLKSGPIYTPDQYTHIIRNAKKTGTPYKVYELSYDDFIDIKALATSIGKNYSKNTEKEIVKITDIVILKVEAEDTHYSYYYKNSYETNNFKKVIVENIGKTRNSSTTNKNISLKRAYKTKMTICENKKKGLLTLLNKKLIPRFYAPFFENL